MNLKKINKFKLKKKKENRRELKKQRDLLHVFFQQMFLICLQHTQLRVTARTPRSIEAADMFLIFNAHCCTTFFAKYFGERYTPFVELQTEFIKDWEKQMKEVNMPLYEEELKKISEKYLKKSKDDTLPDIYQ